MCDGCTHNVLCDCRPAQRAKRTCCRLLQQQQQFSMHLPWRVCIARTLELPSGESLHSQAATSRTDDTLLCVPCPACCVSCCAVLTSDSSLPAYSDIQTALKAPESYHPVIQHSWTVSSNIRNSSSSRNRSLCTLLRCFGLFREGGWAVVGSKGSPPSPPPRRPPAAPTVLC